VNLRDVLAFIGLCLMATGLGLFHPWLGISVGGLGLLLFAVFLMEGDDGGTE